MLNLNEQDEYAASQQNAPGWFFLLVWVGWVVLTIAGFLGGKWLSEGATDFLTGSNSAPRVLSVEGLFRNTGITGFFVALVSGGLAGIVLGVAQAILLLPFIKVAGALEWLVATVMGRSVQWGVIYAIAISMRSLTIDQSFIGLVLLFAMLIMAGVLSGVALGYPQSQVFRRRSTRSAWWTVTNAIATSVTAFVIAMTLLVESQNTIRDYSTLLTAIFCAIATGFALLDILHHPRPAAEWPETLAWDRNDRIIA